MSNAPFHVIRRMLDAGNALLGPDPTIKIGSFGRLQLEYTRPNVAALFEVMDAARLQDPDGYSNAERVAEELGAALLTRGLSSLDEMLGMLDAAYPYVPKAPEPPPCQGCGASRNDPIHSSDCPFRPDATRAKRAKRRDRKPH